MRTFSPPFSFYFLIMLVALFASVALTGCNQGDEVTNAPRSQDSAGQASDKGPDVTDTLASNRDAAGTDATLDIPTPEPDITPDVSVDPYPGVGHTWVVNLNDGTWVRPDNIDKLTAVMGEAITFFVGIHARTETTADLILSVGTGDTQDFCSRTIVMDGVALLDEGLFRFGPRDFTIANGTLTEGLMIQGVFSDDFSTLEDMEMEGVLVVATVPDDILPLPANTSPCDVLGALTVQCTECKDGTMECLDTRLENFGGVAVPGLALVENLLADCHPQCEASTENEDCDTSGW